MMLVELFLCIALLWLILSSPPPPEHYTWAEFPSYFSAPPSFATYLIAQVHDACGLFMYRFALALPFLASPP